jgi:hypothetical protein
VAEVVEVFGLGFLPPLSVAVVAAAADVVVAGTAAGVVADVVTAAGTAAVVLVAPSSPPRSPVEPTRGFSKAPSSPGSVADAAADEVTDVAGFAAAVVDEDAPPPRPKFKSSAAAEAACRERREKSPMTSMAKRQGGM